MNEYKLKTVIDMRTLNSYNSKLFSTPFGKPFGVVMLCVLLLWQGKAWGQLSISAANTPVTIDFSTTVTGVNNGAFNPFSAPGGTVSEATPSSGKLDADAWHFINDGASITSNSTFGTAQIGGRNAAFATAPGASANNATGAGWYGFNIGGTNRALGWQPDGSFATDGAITLRLQNNVPATTITTLDIFYNVYEINNSGGSNTVRFFHSNAPNSWGAANEITSMQVTSVNAAPGATINVSGTNVVGTTVTITHAAGANSAMNLNDIVFFNNAVANPALRNQSGYITGMAPTTTTVAIDPAVGAAAASHGAGGQFTVAPVIVHTRRVTLNVIITPGSYYYLRWYLGGTGADEMALDNITITANPLGLQLTNTGVATIIDFDNTLANVNNGTFTAPANIAVLSPLVGQLDADSWAFVNNGAPAAPGGNATFGGVATGGQGVSPGNVGTAGWYGFDVPDPTSIDPLATTRTLGWQSSDGNFATAGMITLRMFNATGANLLDFRISFTIWERNNTDASNRVRVYISNDNNNYTLTSVTHTSVAAAAAEVKWQGTLYTFTARTHIPALSVAPGAPFYLRFYIDHASGSGQGDEMAIDDITIIPSATTLTSINPNRNIVWAYDGFDYYEGTNVLNTFKGVETIAGIFSTGPLELDNITISNDRYRTTNGYASLGWAGDWINSPASPNVFYVTRGQEEDGLPAKPTIPITSASQQRSLVNSGMYVETGEDGDGNPATLNSIGRRLQTSTAGYAFQYTATSTTDFTPCIAVNADCPAISPLRLRRSDRQDTRSINHIRVEANQGADMQRRWSHTNNVVFGARGSTVWVGVMLRKNYNNDDPVFISLHRNDNPWDASTNNAIQIGYFGTPSNNGGNRYWGVRINGNVTINPANTNTRITTAQMINAGLINKQPDAQSLEERVFDLLVVRIDFSLGQAAAVANVGDLSAANAQPNYSNPHRVRMYVIRDIARDGNTPNGSAYPVNMTNPSVLNNPAFNPLNYGPQGVNFDHLADDIPDSDGNGINDFEQYVDLEHTISNTVDLSFHSVALVAGGNYAGAFDEFRLGGTFNQAALNSPIVSLIRGLCSANGGTLGAQVYQGGDFGYARCLREDGTRVPEPATINITGITQAAQATITHLPIPQTLTNPDDPRQQILRVGDVVTISGVSGMTQINGLSGRIVSRPNNTTSVVNINTTSFGAYTGGGNFSRVNDCPGTISATSASPSPVDSDREVYDPNSTDVWGSNVPESIGDYYDGDHPSYAGGLVADFQTFTPGANARNNVMRGGGTAQLYPGGPLNRTISGGQYTYQLNLGSGPNDNHYLIGTQSRHSFGGPAWIPFYDNSPNKNGYLMSINASYARGKFFDQTVSGLCADTQYEFSVDVINVLRETRTITNFDPNTGAYAGGMNVATDICNPRLEPGCAQFSRLGSGGSVIGLGSVTRGGTGANGENTGIGTGLGVNNFAFSLNPEIDFALNDVPIYTVPVSIPNDKRWHRVGLTFVTKANLAAAINLSVRNIAPGGMGNDLAIDNISFRPCGSFSRLLDQNTLCSQEGDQRGRIYVQIGKAGASFSNAVVRFQKWTPFPHPIMRLITNMTNTNPAQFTMVGANGTYGIPYCGLPGGTEVALYDLTGTTIVDGTVATLNSKNATTVTLNFNATSVGAYAPNTGVLRVRALLDPAITGVVNSGGNTRINFAGSVTDDLEVGMQVTLNGFLGVICLNGQTGRIIAKDATGIILNIPFCGGTYTNSATERIELMYGSDDLNNNGIPEENEWVSITFNPYNGLDYSSVPVTDLGNLYQAPSPLGMPSTPVAINRTITPYNVFYSKGSHFRALFAGNQANLDEESGRCRFIVPSFKVECSILPAVGGNLSGVKKTNGIQLIWKAYQERSDMKYVLERSDDSRNFYPIAHYDAMNRLEYRHLDGAPFIGNNYYRVRIVESNGAFTYTNTVSIDWNEKGGVSIYPNPASNEVNVMFASDFSTDHNVSVRLLNNMGALMGNKSYKLREGEKRLVIPTNDLPDGLYLLEIKVGDLDKIVHKLVIKK